MKIIVNNLAIEYSDEAKAVQDGSPDSEAESRGSGPVILLLHGWMTSLHTFDGITPLLSGNFRMVRLDFPGFGGSEEPKEPWGIGNYAHFVQNFCEKLGIQPEILVGHSFGGRVILKGVSEGVFTPRKLVLIASAGLKTHKCKAKLFLVASKIGKIGLIFLPNGIQERLRRKLYGTAGSTDYLDISSTVMKETFLRSTKEDLADSAQRIHVPTLIIWGKNDVVTPLSDGKRLQTLISGSKLEVIDDARHFVHEERAEKVAKLIKEFVMS